MKNTWKAKMIYNGTPEGIRFRQMVRVRTYMNKYGIRNWWIRTGKGEEWKKPKKEVMLSEETEGTTRPVENVALTTKGLQERKHNL